MRKNIAMESTKVSVANISANQRANRTGVTIAASAPITGRRIIHVRSLANIMNFPSLHKHDQREDKYRQDCNTTKEANHVSLHSTCLNPPCIAPNRRHQSRSAIDQPINDVSIECLLDM